MSKKSCKCKCPTRRGRSAEEFESWAAEEETKARQDILKEYKKQEEKEHKEQMEKERKSKNR